MNINVISRCCHSCKIHKIYAFFCVLEPILNFLKLDTKSCILRNFRGQNHFCVMNVYTISILFSIKCIRHFFKLNLKKICIDVEDF